MSASTRASLSAPNHRSTTTTTTTPTKTTTTTTTSTTTMPPEPCDDSTVFKFENHLYQVQVNKSDDDKHKLMEVKAARVPGKSDYVNLGKTLFKLKLFLRSIL